MNKSELIDAIAKASKLTKADAERALNATIGSITKALKGGHKVQLIGFGTFEVRKRAARMGRNPKTGKELKIAATKVPAFSAGKTLKDAVK
jgi:nucleoid DNA-binding protein